MTNERDEFIEMIGAYALDATDDLERARVERLLAEDPEARRELARYEDALAALVTDEIAVEPPADTWAGIAERVAASPRQVAAPARANRGRAWLAIAAGVLILALGGTFGIANLGDGPSARSELAAALRDPDAGTGSLDGSAGRAAIAVRSDGRGYLDVSTLAPLPAGKVYQLWSVDTTTPVSLGVVKGNGVATFEAPPDSRRLALSIESAPGADQPTLPIAGSAELA